MQPTQPKNTILTPFVTLSAVEGSRLSMKEQQTHNNINPQTKTPKRVPKLRFKEFSEEWKNKKYNEIYSFYSTNSFSRDKLNYDKGEVKNIHYGDIHTKFSTLFDIEKELVPFINQDVDLRNVKNENYLIEGDLLIADASEDYNDIGKTIEVVNLNNEKVISGLHTFHARPVKYSMALGFSGYMLQNKNVRKQVMMIAQGTKVLGLATNRLGSINLSIPSLPEQQKIASFLSSVDKKIDQLQQKQHLLEQYKKGVMQQVFSQQLRFKDENGNDYPDWEEKKLGSFCSFFSGGTPTSTNKAFYSGNIPFIGSGNISDADVDSFVTDEAVKNSSAKIVEKGDLLYALYGATSGEVAVSKIKGAINQAVLCIRTEESKEFLYQLLKYNKDKITSKFLQGGQGNLSANILKKLNIILPIKEEQTKIANFLSAIDNKIDLVNTQLETTQLFKKGLLQQMFV